MKIDKDIMQYMKLFLQNDVFQNIAIYIIFLFRKWHLWRFADSITSRTNGHFFQPKAPRVNNGTQILTLSDSSLQKNH